MPRRSSCLHSCSCWSLHFFRWLHTGSWVSKAAASHLPAIGCSSGLSPCSLLDLRDGSSVCCCSFGALGLLRLAGAAISCWPAFSRPSSHRTLLLRWMRCCRCSSKALVTGTFSCCCSFGPFMFCSLCLKWGAIKLGLVCDRGGLC